MFYQTNKRARRESDEALSDKQSASWQTSRTNPGAVPTFASRMTLSFALTAVMTVALLVAVLAVMWEGQFQQYTRQNMVRLATNTASTIASRYQEEGGWNEKVLNAAIVATNSSSDVGVQVLNADGTVLYDETWPQGASTDTDGLLDGTTENASLAPTSTDSVVSAPIVVDGKTVGSVRVWAFGSDALLTKSDAAFRANSYGVIAGAAGAAILLACIMGVFVSRSLTRPLKRITTTARAIRNGDLTARTGLSGDDEIGELGQVFDDMANTIERDMKTEHRLTSDVAHELRTPLMAMLVNVEAMQDGVFPADEEHLGIVASEVRRLSRLVDAMLALSRMENGTTQMNLEPTEMVELVAHLASMQKPLFADQGLTLSCHIDMESPEVYAYVDRDLVKQALVNLLSNALRYTPEGGRVDISISENNKDVLISVADTGIGIAKEDLGNVFSRFWRSDASRERVSGGLGVGLALTKEIVQRMNGIISVESELGVGTTFTLHLPKVKTNSLGSTGSLPRITGN